MCPPLSTSIAIKKSQFLSTIPVLSLVPDLQARMEDRGAPAPDLLNTDNDTFVAIFHRQQDGHMRLFEDESVQMGG